MKNPPSCEGHSASTDLKSSTKLVVSSVIGTGVAVLGLAGLYCHIQSEKVDALTEDVSRLASSVNKVIEDNSVHQSSQKVELEALKQQLDALKKVISTEGVAVVDMQLKAQGYWDAAKKARAEGSKLAHVLYVSAMTCAENKHEIMMDYVAWRSEELGKIATVNPIDAEQLVADTAVLCDNLLSQASVSDLEKFEELRSALDALKKQQEAGEAAFVEEKRKQMKIWRGEITNAQQDILQEIQASLQALDGYTDLSAERDDLLQQVAWRLDCKTEHTAPLRIPVVAQGTPWEDWLKNFNERLRHDELSIESRLADYAQANEVLQAAADVESEDVKDELEKIREAHGILSALLWKQEFDKLKLDDINSGQVDKNKSEQIEQLLKVTAMLPETARKMINVHEDTLRRIQVDKQIDALAKQKTEFQKAPTELKLQLVAGVYMQAYRYRQALSSESELFGTQLAQLDALIAEIQLEYDKETKEPGKIVEMKRRQAEETFIADAEYHISKAEEYYQSAKQLADEWFTTWGNETAQEYLKYGWLCLMWVDRNDLNRLAPNLNQRWTEVKSNIESKLEPEYKPSFPEVRVRCVYPR